MGEVPPRQPKICSFLPPPEKISPSRLPPLPNFYFPPHPKMQFPHYITIFKLQRNKNIIFICSHCSCTIFVLISYSLDTQVILILILIYIQHSQKVQSPPLFNSVLPPLLTAIWKNLKGKNLNKLLSLCD